MSASMCESVRARWSGRGAAPSAPAHRAQGALGGRRRCSVVPVVVWPPWGSDLHDSNFI